MAVELLRGGVAAGHSDGGHLHDSAKWQKKVELSLCCRLEIVDFGIMWCWILRNGAGELPSILACAARPGAAQKG